MLRRKLIKSPRILHMHRQIRLPNEFKREKFIEKIRPNRRIFPSFFLCNKLDDQDCQDKCKSSFGAET
jgi:hypothetical protein